MYKIAGILICLLAMSNPVSAEVVDVQLLKTLTLKEAVLQVAATADGNRIYVLTNGGKVEILDRDGNSQGGFDVGPEIVSITPQGKNRLLLEDAGRHELLQLELLPRVEISVADAPLKGRTDAPVTIAIFDDFECPYCSHSVELLDELIAKYPQQVRVVFKNFPLQMHKYSQEAAIAALAAQRQGKFWELHNLLFANYDQLNSQKIAELAVEAGLDMVQFEKDCRDPQLQESIAATIAEGKAIGVRGTPTLFINGRKVQRRTMAAMSRMIEEELIRLQQGGEQ
jgi:2-hydroxychromene-2-carboxylate isomerase